jgi:hypothetical protein
MLLLDSSGQELVVTAARGIEATVHQGGRVPVGRVSLVASRQRSSR